MYMMEDMIDMGLRQGETWPTDAHRVVAANLAICNPLIKNRDSLTEVVQAVLKIPADKIETVTVPELVNYGLGFVVSPTR